MAAPDSNKYCPILCKNLSWSPDIQRQTEWRRLKHQQRRRFRRSKSLDATSRHDSHDNITDDDIKELTACFELGFGFDPFTDLDPKLTQAFPALELYAAVNRRFNHRNLSRTSSSSSDSSSSSSSNSNVSSSLIVDPSDEPEKVKMRLRRWAQVVACSVHEASREVKTEVAECTLE